MVDPTPADGGEDAAQWGNVSAERLRSLVERIERLEEDRKALGSDIRDIFAEAKSAGFCAKTLRQVVRLRRLDGADLQEQDHMLALYRKALGV
jgi:uncharacterized protein (UPF0335 family)